MAEIGWDIGGAHVKACLVEGGRVRDAAQWPCPLWQGLQHLDAALDAARAHLETGFGLRLDAVRRHAVTMTGEMTDLFPTRRAGVAALAGHVAARLGPAMRLWAGSDARWIEVADADAHWDAIASANWLATAAWAARAIGDGVLVDIGSTTTDLIALKAGLPAPIGASDGARLATGELVYLGVVRTPLCALARHVPFAGTEVNVMNEFFATSADVFRLTGELDPAHDQQPSADGGAKDAAATRRRLARMIGRDEHEAEPAAWRALAGFWRDELVQQIAQQLSRVSAAATLPQTAPIVACGAGAFLAGELAARSGRPLRRFADTLPLAAPSLAGWAEVCAPAAAVALLALG